MKSNQTLGVLFFIRKDKNPLQTKACIYLRITVNRVRAEISLKRYIEISKWVPGAGRARGNIEEFRKLNEYLSFWESKICQIHNKLIEKNLPVSAEVIKTIALGENQQQKTLLEVFQYHNVQFAETIGIDHSKGTLTRYELLFRLIKKFLKEVYHKEDIILSELSYKFLTDLEHYFKVVRKCNLNTSSVYIKNLRRIIHIAMLNQWLEKDPFAGYKATFHFVDRGFLNEDELDAIETKIIQIPRIEAVRDIFVFCCYTGLAYADVAKLKWDNILTGIDGEKWISISRQ